MPLISMIPEDYVNGFKELSLLNDETFAALQDAMSSIKLSASTFELADKVAELKSLDRDLIFEIFESVEGLVSFLSEESNIEEISNDVASICISEKSIEEADAGKLKDRVQALLIDKKLYYAYKAVDLLTEAGNTFLHCKIVTDIRPIFDLDVEQPPKAGVLTHTLHIHYQGDGAAPHEDFYITLDSNDIGALMETLIRAEKKEESLKSIFKKSDMINLSE